MNEIQEKILAWAQGLGSFYKPDAFIISDVPEELGSKEEIETAVESLHIAEHLESEESINGIFWARRPMGLPTVMSRPSIDSIAEGIARSRGARLIIAERCARGFLGIEERYSAETPHIIGLSGIDSVKKFGSRDGQPLIVAEPVPQLVLDHETDLSHMVIQGFRKLIAEESEDAIDAAVHHAIFGMHPSLLIEHAALARLELDDPYKTILERLVCEAKKHAVSKIALPKMSAPPDWSPPETFDGATVAGSWQVVSAVITGIEYRVIFGGDLFGHPGIAASFTELAKFTAHLGRRAEGVGSDIFTSLQTDATAGVACFPVIDWGAGSGHLTSATHTVCQALQRGNEFNVDNNVYNMQQKCDSMFTSVLAYVKKGQIISDPTRRTWLHRTFQSDRS